MWDFRAYHNRVALVDEYGTTLTYAELREGTDKLFEQIGHRCLIFILCRNCIGAIMGYTAALNHRVVPMMLSASADRDVLDDLLNRYAPEYLWLPCDVADSFGYRKKGYTIYGYCLVETGCQTKYPLLQDLALLLTTSGSTGSPKFVRQSYQNISANTESIIQYLEIDGDERAITTLPMHYTYGLSVINTHLSAGATICLIDRGLMQREFWQFFKDHEITSFAGVPYTYEMLDKLRFYRMELPSLHTMTQAGGKLSPQLQEEFAEYADQNGKKFVVMYGQCEATARMGYLPAEKAIEKKGSMGIAIPGGKFWLADEEGNEIKSPHTPGELMYEGENVTLGYAESGEDLSKGDERKGILATGDMAEFDEDSYYYIVGRKKRFLKIYGNRVNLDEMDRLVRDRLGIDVASAGVDDHMYIFVEESDRCDDVKKYIVGKTGLNPAAFHVMGIEQIPRNDAGKIQYTVLEKYYA